MQQSVDVDLAIRSVRVAAALNERFGQIAKPKTYGNSEDLENVLGEARQIYPAIWANLDDARAALARRGVVVAAYDSLRAEDSARAAGVLTVHVDGTALDGTEKSARMNLEGHAVAAEACNVLRRAMPDVDWAGLDRADAQEIEAIGSLRPPKWKAFLFGAIAIAAVGTVVALYLYLRVTG